MKKILIILFLIISLVLEASTDEYKQGFKDGYRQGWCYQQGLSCVSPIPPLAPLARINEDNYQGGYNREFSQALNDR